MLSEGVDYPPHPLVSRDLQILLKSILKDLKKQETENPVTLY